MVNSISGTYREGREVGLTIYIDPQIIKPTTAIVGSIIIYASREGGWVNGGGGGMQWIRTAFDQDGAVQYCAARLLLETK